MQESLWKIAMFLLVVILLVVFPTLQLWEMQDRVIQLEITTAAAEFLDTVRYTRQINDEYLQKLMDKLHILEPSLTIELSHKFSYWIPITDANGHESGEVKQVYMQIGNSEIRENLAQLNDSQSFDKTYPLREGDWFEITVKNTEKTNAQRLRAYLFRIEHTPARFYVCLSGFIH